MKVIELLNKIANGEEVPKKIIYKKCVFTYMWKTQDYYFEKYGNLFEYLITSERTRDMLNYELKVIEKE